MKALGISGQMKAIEKSDVHASVRKVFRRTQKGMNTISACESRYLVERDTWSWKDYLQLLKKELI